MSPTIDDLAAFNPNGLDDLPFADEAPFAPPPPPDLWGSERSMTVIAFDQALANTGWVVVRYDFFAPPLLYALGTIKTPPLDDRVSWDDTLERSTRLMAGVLDLLYLFGPDLVLHEMPPVGGGPFVRAAYSSVVAAVSVRTAAYLTKAPVDHISAQSVKKFLTGNGNAKKQEVRKAINALIESGRVDTNPAERFQLNEHIADAIGIALAYKGLQHG
jgi:Holliday junction resolvasome RuvABC endonuclease subunit